ncbi:MAG: YncE family protein [Flammeovirgaceae bacterium]
MKKLYAYLLILPLLLQLTACDDDTIVGDGEINPPVETTYTDGVFVINEGNFGTPNGSISFFDGNTNILSTKVFQTKNNRALGDVIQSFTIEAGIGYVIVNNDNKMEVVNAETFAQIATVENLHLPRYFLKVSDTKAYITNWGNFSDVSAYIAVFDLTTNTVTSTITDAAFSGLEHMALMNGKVYVSNNFSNTVSVIDVTTNQVSTHLTIGDAPKKVYAVDGNIWVLTSGSYNFTFNDPTDDTKGKIVKIDPSDNSIDLDLEIGVQGDHPGTFETDGSSLFFVNSGNTYKMETTDNSLPTTPLISGKFFYGLSIDPTTGNIYGGDANGFTALGSASIYDSNGNLLKQFFTGGIGPNGFVFVN